MKRHPKISSAIGGPNHFKHHQKYLYEKITGNIAAKLVIFAK
jgi:hypothetical protein